MPKNLMTLDIATAACDICQPIYNVAPTEPVQSGAEPRVKGVTFEKKVAKAYSVKKVLLYQSKNRVRKELIKGEQVPARDLKYGDLSKEQIIELLPGSGPWFARVQPKNGTPSRSIEEWSETLFKSFVSTAQAQFARGKMDDVIKSMIYHMRDGKGKDYKDSKEHKILMDTIMNHKNTKTFITQVQKVLLKYIVAAKGNVGALVVQGPGLHNTPLWYPMQSGVGHLKFSGVTDTLNGLQICINDVWGYEIYLKDYQSDGNSFTSTLYIDAYDHFGLDEADLKWYTSGDPFFSWFILQRWNGFGGAYKPFVTRIPIEEDFRGDL